MACPEEPIWLLVQLTSTHTGLRRRPPPNGSLPPQSPAALPADRSRCRPPANPLPTPATGGATDAARSGIRHGCSRATDTADSREREGIVVGRFTADGSNRAEGVSTAPFRPVRGTPVRAHGAASKIVHALPRYRQAAGCQSPR